MSSFLPRCALGATLSVLMAAAGAAPGDLDCTFGVGGIVSAPLATPYEIALQGTKVIGVSGGGGSVRLMRWDAAGTLDATFGSGGTSLAAFPGVTFAGQLAVDDQQRIVVAAQYTSGDSKVFVARFLADGAVDTAFGNGGSLVFDFSAATTGTGNEAPIALAIDHAGRPVIGGFFDANGGTFNPSNSEMAVARLTTAGQLDTGFGSGGIATASSPDNAHDDDIRAVAIDSLGRIVAIGSTSYPNTFNSGPRNTILARWTATGGIDTGFAGTGVAILDLSQAGSDDFGIDVAIDGSDRIYALGQGTDDPLLARLTTAGVLDTGFNGTGIVQRSFVGGQDVVEHVRLQSDGRILVTGWPIVGNNFHIATMRFLANGTLDTSWGGTGVVTNTIAANERAYAAVLQTDDKLILAGGVNNDQRMFLLRYLNGAAMPVATAIALTSAAPDPSAQSQAVTAIYSVTAGTLPAPPGDVTVSDGVDSCVGTAAAGGCLLTLHTGGTRSLVATYPGNACYAGSTSAGLAHTVKYVVTPASGTGGTTNPPTAQNIVPGNSAVFDLMPNSGYRVGSASGCGGSLAGAHFTTAPVHSNCTVTASFLANPIATAGAAPLFEDGTKTGQLVASGNGTLTYSVVQDVAHGTLSVDAQTGMYTYTPSADFNGSDSFTFKVNDGNADSNTATMTLNVGAVNDAPTLGFGTSPTHPANATGAQTVTGFAHVAFGPADENASQAVSEFLIDAVDDPAGILTAGTVTLATNGDLGYTLSGHAGLVTITARVRDSGGTQNGGIDISAPVSFTIYVDDRLFADDFE